MGEKVKEFWARKYTISYCTANCQADDNSKQ